MAERLLHHALLRPAIIQILRAQGFSGARPSVVDTLTDIAAKYVMLLATRSLEHAQTCHDDTQPDITDIRMAMTDCGILQPSTTATEDVWTELLRKPIDELPDRNQLRRREEEVRDEQDTEDITTFVNWFKSNACREITRVAGLLPEEDALDEGERTKPQDYLATLKKKHSKTGEGSRYTGTVLGKEGEMRSVKIDGSTGMPESIGEWQERVRERSRKLAAVRQGNGPNDLEESIRSVDMEDAG
jgi:transcription initiation factor TFIID subunit 3